MTATAYRTFDDVPEGHPGRALAAAGLAVFNAYQVDSATLATAPELVADFVHRALALMSRRPSLNFKRAADLVRAEQFNLPTEYDHQ